MHRETFEPAALAAGFILTGPDSGSIFSKHRPTKPGEQLMPKFLIEREIPKAGSLTPEQLQGISQKSCSVLRTMGPKIQWLHSYVTGDKIYCVYIAENEADVRQHAKQGGFPANRVSEIVTVIDPTTAEV
jgi:hypothetical protein